ncbi:MAG: GNAT family N-acetyltransferase [Planctomycetes bacterium]|nr:GNAT family N-acetyltransferase [Planctomycetota bacterium]
MARKGRVELLRGAHVLLREMDEDDAQLVVAWRNGPESRKWLIQWDLLTVDVHLEWFRKAKRRGELLIMFDALDGEPVGATSIYDFDRPKTSAQWGRLCAAQVGRHPHGILEGCYLVQRLCFEALGMFRLHGEVASENQRAYRLYEFLGYVKEGLRRKHWVHPGGYYDVLQIGIFPEEFEAHREKVEAKLYPDTAVPEITVVDVERIKAVLGR